MSDEKQAHGTFCWNELMTRDVDSAKKFYSELVGWSMDDSSMPGMDYTLMKVGDKPAGGMMAMPKEVPAEYPSHWVAYITVDDVDAAAKKVLELGGKLLHDIMDIPEVGRFVTIQDPTGAAVALITLASE